MAREEKVNYKKADYVSTEQEEDIYSDRITKEDRPIINIEKVLEAQPDEMITQIKRVTHPRMKEWKGPKSLNRDPPEVFGTLFDRLRFLQDRETELQEMIEQRTSLHKDVIEEISKDIQDKEKTVSWLSDIEEKRNFKLDISILRRDKRFELLQFWRDTMELKTEIRQVMEQIETEGNIVNIFHEQNGERPEKAEKAARPAKRE
jgi:hypothetical protein